MIGRVKLIEETDLYMRIGYSVERNKQCDGILFYDKKSEEFTIEKLCQGEEDDFTTKRFICPLRSFMREKGITKEIGYIATG